MSHGETPHDPSSSIPFRGEDTTSLGDPVARVDSAAENAFFDMPQTSGASTAISIAVDPVALITTECITVTSAMRKHARWAHSSVSAILGGGSGPVIERLEISRPSTPRDGATGRVAIRNERSLPADARSEVGLASRWGLRGKKGRSMQDNPLMAAFARLRSDLNGCKGDFTTISRHIQIGVRLGG